MKTTTVWHQRIFVTASLLVLAGASARTTLPYEIQAGLLAALVVLLGLPHGALDPLVAQRANLWTFGKGLLPFLCVYTLLAVAALLVWMLVPAIALAAFLAFSAWHFAGDWHDPLPRPLALSAGMYVVTGPVCWHGAETLHYFTLLSDATSAATINTWSAILAIPALAGLVGGAVIAWRKSLGTSAELIALAAAIAVLPPLLFFVLYFCGLHSPRHIIHAVEGIKPRPAIVTATVFTGLAVLGGAVSLLFLPDLSLSSQLIRVTFTGLSVLTVPHMILVEYATTD